MQLGRRPADASVPAGGHQWCVARAERHPDALLCYRADPARQGWVGRVSTADEFGTANPRAASCHGVVCALRDSVDAALVSGAEVRSLTLRTTATKTPREGTAADRVRDSTATRSQRETTTPRRWPRDLLLSCPGLR